MVEPSMTEIRRTIAALFPRGTEVVELRVFGQEGQWSRIWSGYFDDHELLAEVAQTYASNPNVYGTYITLNPCEPALISRAANRMVAKPKHSTKDTEIESRHLLFIDIDPVRPAGVSASDEEKKAAREVAFQVYQALLPHLGQAITADSGNGWHLLYPLDLPNDEASTETIQELLNALDFKFSNEQAQIDTKVYNAARITKLYGTPSKKGDSVEGRPHRVSKLITIPEFRRGLGLDDLQRAIDVIRPAEKVVGGKDTTREGGAFDVDIFLEEAGLSTLPSSPWRGGRKWIFPVCPFNEEHTDSSSYVVQFPSGALAAGCLHESCTWEWRDLRGRFGKEPPTGTGDLGGDIRWSDMGNAEILVQRFGQGMLWVAEWGAWALWTGRVWKRDSTGEVVRRAKLVADVRYAYADSLEGKEWKKAHDFARSCESLERIRAMDQLARAQPGMTVSASDFDKDPWQLNCRNGVLDLQSGNLEQHDRHQLLSNTTGINYNPDAKCPRWEQFLREIFDNDEDLVRYVQRLAGYILTGSVREQVLPIFYGSGNNGKSTFLLTLRKIMGDYAKQVAPDILMANRKDSHPASIAVLKGTRLALTVETGRGKAMDEALVKQLTGGDPIQARFMRQDPFEFMPTHKIVMATNYHPVIKGDDIGIWRRIRLVPFNVSIPADKVDKDLMQKLESELEGILAWAVEGCLQWNETGLQTPDSIKQATDKYRKDQDLISDFVEDYCEIDESYYIPSSELYQAYCLWCDDEGMRRPSKRGLGMILGERGFVNGRVGGKRVWFGLRLQVEGQYELSYNTGQEVGEKREVE